MSRILYTGEPVIIEKIEKFSNICKTSWKGFSGWKFGDEEICCVADDLLSDERL